MLDLGTETEARHRFSFWDCMILAAARAQGCDIVWSEDMQDGRIVEGMRVGNPFGLGRRCPAACYGDVR
ncbi:MAG TPA: hypothetical protein VGC56_04380 [Allosphingosinicella sp.]